MSERATPPRPDGVSGGSPTEPTSEASPAPWRWYEGLAVYVLALLASVGVAVPVASLLGGGTGIVMASLLGDLVALGALLFWLNRYHRGWTRTIRFPARVGPEIWAGIAWGVGVYIAGVFVIAASIVQILVKVTDEAVRTPDQLPARLSTAAQVVVVLRAVVAAPIAEELFFRGVLFGAFRARRAFWPSALWSSLVFGLVHAYPGSWQGMVALMATLGVVGLFLCVLYERRGNLVANVVAHATFNVVGLAVLTWAG